MEEFTDYIEYDRPNGEKVRVGFELYRNEILFHFCEFKSAEKETWQSMKKDDAGYHNYKKENGETSKILYPTPIEIAEASDIINKKYNLLDV